MRRTVGEETVIGLIDSHWLGLGREILHDDGTNVGVAGGRVLLLDIVSDNRDLRAHWQRR
jgi:hypothetical protein